MANPASQDDGLIILSDDSWDTSPSTAALSSESLPSEESILDFSLTETKETPISSPVTISRPVVSSQEPSLDIDFDLTWWTDISSDAKEVSSSVEVTPVPQKTQIQDGSSSFGTSILSKESSLDEEVDMDGILDKTISQLKTRQEVIAQAKGNKTSRIADLNQQIQELQQQVTELQEDVVDLDDENARIDTNISSLENMKMFEKTQEEEKTREHNLKKVAQK